MPNRFLLTLAVISRHFIGHVLTISLTIHDILTYFINYQYYVGYKKKVSVYDKLTLCL